MEIESTVMQVLMDLGMRSRPADGKAEVIVDLEGMTLALQLKHRSLVNEDVARRLLDEAPTSGAALLVVADRVTDTARRMLTSHRSGYLDLRGRLALRAPGVVIDAEVEPVKGKAGRSTALSGKAGLAVAAEILLHPGPALAVREMARRLHRSPSTVSDVLAGLRRDGLIDSDNSLVDTGLFWRVADRWSARRIPLAEAPGPGDGSLVQALRFGLDDPETRSGWALTDTAAAAAYGAPVAFRSDHALDFFVPDQSIVQRATALLGAAQSVEQARATIRVAPTPAAVCRRVDLDRSPAGWPLAHPLFVALDLAQDVGRGREILEAWTPDERWTRAW